MNTKPSGTPQQLMQQQQHQAQPIAMGAQMPATTRTGWASQSADKRYALFLPELQQMKQILGNSHPPYTPDQRNKIFQIFKTNPALKAAFIKHRQQFNQHGGGIGGPFCSKRIQQVQLLRSRTTAMNTKPNGTPQQLIQQQHQAQPIASMGAQMPATTRTGWTDQFTDKRYALFQPELQQLKQILKSSHPPDQRRDKVIKFLKANPAFMAALMKHVQKIRALDYKSSSNRHHFGLKARL